MDGSGAESCGLYLFSHIFGPQEYTLVNMNVVSSLVPENIFFSKKLSISVAKEVTERTVPERNLAVYIFFTHTRFRGVQPGQYISPFGPRSRTIFFFQTQLSLFIAKIVPVPKVPEWNFSVYIFFDTSEQKRKPLLERCELQRHYTFLVFSKREVWK